MYEYVKRFADILFSFMGLIILAPLLILISIMIKKDSTGPVLFRQKRVGIHKNYFLIWKFRTMKQDTPKNCPTHRLENPEIYLTKLGCCLRKTSLDELPQLWNILKGDMSFVGPRPALWNQKDLVRERDRYGANDVKPGLTGLAQVNGRDTLEIRDKARLDGYYAKNIGFAMDLFCVIKTFFSVLRADGIVEGAMGDLHRGKEKKTGERKDLYEKNIDYRC